MQQAHAVYVDPTDSCSDAASELERVKLGVGWNLSVTWLVNVACVFALGYVLRVYITGSNLKAKM